MSDYFGNNMDEDFSKFGSPIGSGSFDETIRRQVDQFNKRLNYSAKLHQRLLATLCAERVQSAVGILHDDLVRPHGVVRRLLRKLRAEGGRRGGSRTPTYERRAQASQNPGEHTNIIEGEFSVIPVNTDSVTNSNTVSTISPSSSADKDDVEILG